MLFARYNIPEPSVIDESFIEARRIIRLRVGNVIKRWLSEHYHDFGDNPAIIARLKELVVSNFLQNEASLGESIIKLIDGAKVKERENNFSEEAPRSIIPKAANCFEDFDPMELARQFCLYEQALFKTIHTKECLNQGWNSKALEKRIELSPNITRMIKHFNDVSFWVQHQVLQHKKLDQRYKVFKRFIKLLRCSREYNNFNLCQEILSGLSSAAVFRLKKTWAKFERDKKLHDIYDMMKQMMAPTGSYKEYRSVLKNANPPCLPYLGVYLTDLTFIEDGNSNYLDIENRTDIINFEKMRRVSVVIEKIVIYQQQPYNFTKLDSIFNYIENISQIIQNKTVPELFNISLELEPRE
jgi:hypothetical protein